MGSRAWWVCEQGPRQCTISRRPPARCLMQHPAVSAHRECWGILQRWQTSTGQPPDLCARHQREVQVAQRHGALQLSCCDAAGAICVDGIEPAGRVGPSREVKRAAGTRQQRKQCTAQGRKHELVASISGCLQHLLCSPLLQLGVTRRGSHSALLQRADRARRDRRRVRARESPGGGGTDRRRKLPAAPSTTAPLQRSGSLGSRCGTLKEL